MAASIILECPHCGAEKIGFAIVHDVPCQKKMGAQQTKMFRSLLICSNCEEAVVASFRKPSTSNFGAPAACPSDPTNFGYVLLDTYPKAVPPRTPAHATEALKNYFGQASEAARRGNYDASGAMSRKVVDVSTKQLLGDEAKKFNNIQGRIDALAAKHALTPDLQEWAHQVRLGGNEAAHDEEPFDKADAEELLDFVDLYLTYVYTLPGRLAERKARAAALKAQ